MWHAFPCHDIIMKYYVAGPVVTIKIRNVCACVFGRYQFFVIL